MPTDYALYLRKSRADLEAEAHGEGDTLARHEHILMELAKSRALPIGAIYREIVSGERIANRVRKGGHDIPADDVRRRFAGRVKSLAAVLPYCDEATFFDNDNGFVAVAEYRNGVIVCYENAPRWVTSLADAINQP